MNVSKSLKFSFRALSLVVLSVLSSTFSSCNKELDEINPNKAQLNVHVYALINNNPKENATVSVHLTEADADNNVNKVVDKRFTDNDGNVTFRNLDPGKKYWIRTKVLIDKTVNQTEELIIGENYHEVGTL